MKLSGLIFMFISWGFIFSMAVFCFSRTFKNGLGEKESKSTKTVS